LNNIKALKIKLIGCKDMCIIAQKQAHPGTKQNLFSFTKHTYNLLRISLLFIFSNCRHSVLLGH